MYEVLKKTKNVVSIEWFFVEGNQWNGLFGFYVEMKVFEFRSCPGRSAIGREEQRKNSCSDHGLANYLLASECLGLLDKQ